MTQKLGEWLIGKGKLTEEQLQRGLHDKAFFGERLGHSLIKLGFIDEDTLGEYLAEIARTRYAPARRLETVSAEVIATVPGRLAAKYCIAPIAIEGRRLHLAMRDPKDLIALDEIAFLTGLPIEPYVATEFRLIQAIERYYGISLGTKAIPVAPGPIEPQRARVAAPLKSAAPKPQLPEIGLDGLPLNADPGDLDQPFMDVSPDVSPPGLESSGPLPRSLHAWREETPDAAVGENRPAAAPPPVPPRPASPSPVVLPAGPPTVTRPIAVGPAWSGSRSSGAQAVPATPPVLAIETVSASLREAETRDDVFDAVLDFTATRFLRAALFVAQPDRVLGWSGRGGGLAPTRVRNVIVPLDRPSLFLFVRSGADYFYGPVPDLPANAKFYLDLGCPPPARVLLMPLTIAERPAGILYADNGPDSSMAPDVQEFRRLLKKAAMALEILILRNKIMMI
ncbi:MAG TPA: hypothetical protein VGV60_00650 [Candidatus Polarisedimenticolia bacterium]|nr:hypothetical protein [Candidatus Polarisedimenticolia bacterium]